MPFTSTRTAVDLSPNPDICIPVSRIRSEYISLPMQTLYNVSYLLQQTLYPGVCPPVKFHCVLRARLHPKPTRIELQNSLLKTRLLSCLNIHADLYASLYECPASWLRTEHDRVFLMLLFTCSQLEIVGTRGFQGRRRTRANRVLP